MTRIGFEEMTFPPPELKCLNPPEKLRMWNERMISEIREPTATEGFHPLQKERPEKVLKKYPASSVTQHKRRNEMDLQAEPDSSETANEK